MNVMSIQSLPLSDLLGTSSSSFRVFFDDDFRPVSLKTPTGKTNLIDTLYADEIDLLSDVVRAFAIESVQEFKTLENVGLVVRC